MNELKKKFASALFFGLLIVIVAVGIGLRWHTALTPFSSSNVDTFYFHRTKVLVETGAFPKEDRWGFAPEVWPENTPPALAYLTWGAFALWRVFVPQTDLEAFANFFPILMYLVWVAAMTAFLLARGVGRATLVLMVMLLTFTPVAVKVTGYGRYFEEVVGAPALFFAALVFPMARKIDWVWWSGIGALTVLLLSWQAFPFFYAAAVGVMVLGILFGDRDRRAVAAKCLMLFVPFVLAELIVRMFVGNSYSAAGMLKEFYLAFINRNNPVVLNAMYRRDWANTDWRTFIDYYGLAGTFVLAAGVAASLLKPREEMSAGAFGFAVVGVAIVGAFVKFRHFALGLFAAPWLVGIEAAIDSARYFDVLGAVASRSWQWCRRSHRTILRGVCAVTLLATVVILLFRLWYWRVSDPVGNIEVIPKSAEGDLRTVEIRMTNIGGRTSNMKKAFTGLHIAVEGGDILRAEPFTDGIGEPRLATKNFSHWGNTNFFEVSYHRLLEHDSAGVILDIRKTSEKPILIFWRAWLPKYYCSLNDRREGIRDLRSAWRNLSQGWRNERCIVRIPANDDISADFCPTKVFAAHQELQDFRCRKAEIQ